MALPSTLLSKSAALATVIPRWQSNLWMTSREFYTTSRELHTTSREFHTTTIGNQKKPMKQYYDKAEAMMRRTTDEMAAKLRAAKMKKKKLVGSKEATDQPSDSEADVMDDRDKTVMKASAVLVFLIVVVIVARKVMGAKKTGEGLVEE